MQTKIKHTLSVLIITKNADELLRKCLNSVKNLADEIVVVDDYSKDKTIEIAKEFKAKIYKNHEKDLGKQRAYELSKVSREWVLVLDSDEIVSIQLKEEIVQLLNCSIAKPGFHIPFQNHFLGRQVNYGGENYKMLRLFRKDSVTIEPALVHESFKLKKGKAGELKNKIIHYSYRSLFQIFTKFTEYAIREAKQKAIKGEKTSLQKIFLYPLHMFWARFIKDKGYKDGMFRIPLDLGFTYMEWLTYMLLLFYRSGTTRKVTRNDAEKI